MKKLYVLTDGHDIEKETRMDESELADAQEIAITATDGGWWWQRKSITSYKGGRTTHVNVRITPAKKAVLVAEARRLDCTLSDLIEKLAQEPT